MNSISTKFFLILGLLCLHTISKPTDACAFSAGFSASGLATMTFCALNLVKSSSYFSTQAKKDNDLGMGIDASQEARWHLAVKGFSLGAVMLYIGMMSDSVAHCS